MTRKKFIIVLICVAVITNLVTVFVVLNNNNKLPGNYLTPQLYDWQADEFFAEIKSDLDDIVDSLKSDEVFKTKTSTEYNFNWRYLEDPDLTEKTKNKILDFYYKHGYFMISVEKFRESISHISLSLSPKTYYCYVFDDAKDAFLPSKNSEVSELGGNWYKLIIFAGFSKKTGMSPITKF